jgi:hypothetical protein
VKSSFFSSHHLARQVFRHPQMRPRGLGKAVAITAAHRGAGVSYISRLLTDTLNAETPESAALIDSCELLSTSGFDEQHTPLTALRGEGEADETVLPNHPADRLHALRQRHANRILDTASPKASSDWMSFCSLLDGVIIVVEANRTTSYQLSYLEKSIEAASGVVLGHILNKRTYPIPVWLNTQLERLGL